MHLLGQVDPNTQAAHVDVSQTGGQFQRQSSVTRIHLRDDIQDNLTAGGHGTDGALPQQLNTLDMGPHGHTCGGEHRTDGVLSQPGQHELGTHGVSHDQICSSELGTVGVLSQPGLQLGTYGVSHVQTGSSELGTDDVPSQPGCAMATGGVNQEQPISSCIKDISTDPAYTLDHRAAAFVSVGRILGGSRHTDAAADLQQVQQVQAGGVGRLEHGGYDLWAAQVVTGCKGNTAVTNITQELPFAGTDDIPDMFGLAPKEIHKVGRLPDLKVTLPVGDFYDKVLPSPGHMLDVNQVFTPDYFVALHNVTAAAGVRADGSAYGAFTPNHLGARISLPHTKLRLERWRYHLRGYDKVEICQMLEFGFPIGISSDHKLESKTRNHGSSYMWYSYVDKFISKEVRECGVSGPFKLSPWKNLVVSPLMTAHKKPNGRRTVFDATYGDLSVNNATPGDQYMGEPTAYTYPKVEDYRCLVLKAGQGCYMWKRDLSRFFLQLPMDPVDYDKVGIIWRGLFFIFVCLAFGLRHSGLNGQRVTDAVSWILRCLGLETDVEKPFNVVNYVDDLGGVEKTLERARHAFNKLGWLLKDLGLAESVDKAEPPTTKITYLGVEFDSQAMEMRVPPQKLEEIKSEIRRWLKRTTISKKELQSLLGKLFWIARVVKHSRVFLGRMLDQLRSMSGRPDHKKVKLMDDTRKDILWWANYVEHYNGVEMITVEDPIKLSYEQLLDTPHDICAGDATPVGGGAWHGYEYWCDKLPEILQDVLIPIHVKEFWVLIVSAKLWGDTWTGRAVILYCDNDAVCEVIWHKKPRDQMMLSLLREFLYVVVTKKFYPVVRKISSADNHLADHISRRFDESAAQELFSKSGLHGMVRVMPKRIFFNLSATW